MKSNFKKNVAAGIVLFGAFAFSNAQTTKVKVDAAKDPTKIATKTDVQLGNVVNAETAVAVQDNTEALVKEATAQQEAKQWAEAEKTWDKVIAQRPDWAPAFYSKAYVQQSAQQTDQAKASYETFISKVKPEEVEANKKNVAYAYFFVAFAEQQSNLEKAKEYVNKSLQLDPTNQEAIKLKAALKA